jgi:hypothetical protein
VVEASIGYLKQDIEQAMASLIDREATSSTGEFP